ncbi:unnamed protein product [Spirodela intermedia]|uniref:F-box domain-containing protein n=1 Tax=Spirodela intermedia TaxID=51605 RepID=A0A7I8JD01_SPIIN|nr:unnamed protein product [Spirodela intermedia]CAA6667605.1 unnamed protein product [Spirodela intermedia]
MAAAAAAVEELHTDVLTEVLRRLDGPSLAATSCATSHLCAVAGAQHLWEELCLSTWPSLRLLPPLPRRSHRSFFSDVYTFPSPDGGRRSGEPPALLISAVDLLHEGRPVFSRVVQTNAKGRWFSCSPFRVDALDPTEDGGAPPVPAGVSTEGMTLSWILIDPASGGRGNGTQGRSWCGSRWCWTAARRRHRGGGLRGGDDAAAGGEADGGGRRRDAPQWEGEPRRASGSAGRRPAARRRGGGGGVPQAVQGIREEGTARKERRIEHGGGLLELRCVASAAAFLFISLSLSLMTFV